MTKPHIPVLAGEVIDLTDPAAGETVIDCTFGAGGHAWLLGDRIGRNGHLICIDRDPDAANRFAEFAGDVPAQTEFRQEEFSDALEGLVAEGVKADVILLDLGVSSMQIDTLERGFSYVYDAPLDMRMDTSQDLTAAQIVNSWSEQQLAKLFKSYGEERFARPIARAISRRREHSAIETTAALVDVITSAVPAPARFAGGHPAKRVFQALRIAVNGELETLERALPAAWAALAPGGRLAVISFHSLEDRRVKKFLAELAKGCICPPDFPVCRCGREPLAELASRRAIAPTPGEVATNPRSKSSKLRVARKLAEGTI